MSYQVFNPKTGTHTKCDTEQEARDCLITFIKAFYAENKPAITRKFSNEKGDIVWVATQIDENIVIR